MITSSWTTVAQHIMRRRSAHRNLALRWLSEARERFPDELSAHEATWAAGIIALWAGDPEQAGHLFRQAIDFAYRVHETGNITEYGVWAHSAYEAFATFPAEPLRV